MAYILAVGQLHDAAFNLAMPPACWNFGRMRPKHDDDDGVVNENENESGNKADKDYGNDDGDCDNDGND